MCLKIVCLYKSLNFENSLKIMTFISDDTLCKLACTLVQLTKSENNEVVIMASKCLGVLGPVNLRALSLPSTPKSIGLQVALQCFEVCLYFHGIWIL